MEIKVGEYVRTKDGVIGKITKIVTDSIFYVQFYDNEPWKTDIEEAGIVKSSPYIIDLIEVGDVIKYKELSDWAMYGTKANETYILNLKSQREVDKFKKCVEDKDIEFVSIVTHEQFEETEYEV